MTVSTSLEDHRAWVEVDLDNLVANARTIRSVARGASLLPMVKADAYGLGALRVARALEQEEPWGYGVATVDEAITLREAGIVRPVLVFTPPDLGLFPVYESHDLTAVLDTAEVASRWGRPYHLEIDTGMARCGLRWDATRAIAACAGEFLEGVFTHFLAADEGSETVDLQWHRFAAALEALPERPPLVHAANSAGSWRLQQRLDLVRPGIFLFGGRHASDLPGPRPVASVRARVVSLREIREGDSVSYGGDWVASTTTRIATLGIGYADGVPTAVGGSSAEVLIGGERRPIVGRVTMDFIMVALRPQDAVEMGAVATLVGDDGTASITVDEFAHWGGTIGYEILARLGSRLPRRYRSQ